MLLLTSKSKTVNTTCLCSLHRILSLHAYLYAHFSRKAIVYIFTVELAWVHLILQLDEKRGYSIVQQSILSEACQLYCNLYGNAVMINGGQL